MLAACPSRPSPFSGAAPRADRQSPLRRRVALDELDALRRGDQRAFLVTVERMQPVMLRVASLYVRSTAAAEEAVQDAWLGVLRGLHAFEERSSLRRWILCIVANCARARGSREARYVPVSSLGSDDADRPLRGSESPDARDPVDWTCLRSHSADEQMVLVESCRLARQAITALPRRQRDVMLLRDVEGMSASVVCERLRVSGGNQRVLLHRARAKVRAMLETHEAGG